MSNPLTPSASQIAIGNQIRNSLVQFSTENLPRQQSVDQHQDESSSTTQHHQHQHQHQQQHQHHHDHQAYNLASPASKLSMMETEDHSVTHHIARIASRGAFVSHEKEQELWFELTQVKATGTGAGDSSSSSSSSSSSTNANEDGGPSTSSTSATGSSAAPMSRLSSFSKTGSQFFASLSGGGTRSPEADHLNPSRPSVESDENDVTFHQRAPSSKPKFLRSRSNLENEVISAAEGHDVVHRIVHEPIDLAEAQRIPFTLPISVVATALDTDLERGLTDAKVPARLQKFGYNELGIDDKVSMIRVFFSNLFNAMNLILIIATAVSAGVQDWTNVVVIFVVLALNTLIGFFQEYRTEKTMDALQKLSAPTARILRNSELSIESSGNVVPGDIVYLEEGDQVPADLRLVSSVNLEVDEVLLTGETLPARKITAPLNDPEAPLGDRINMAYRSTLVTKGRGFGIAVTTGLSTEIGKIASAVSKNAPRETPTQQPHAQRSPLELQAEQQRTQNPLVKVLKKIKTKIFGKPSEKSPLQIRLETLMFILLGFAVVLAIIVFAANKFVGESEIALYAIAVAIAIIPECLPAVVTVTMALGVRRMAHQKAVVRKLTSLEQLGETTNICSDKTGTITVGRMVATDVWAGRKTYEISGTGIDPKGGFKEMGTDLEVNLEDTKSTKDLSDAAMVCSMCNGATIRCTDDRWVSTGDPTEVALLVMGYKAKKIKTELESQMETICELPFDSVIKKMTVVYRKNTEYHIYMKGAVENVLASCEAFQCQGTVYPLTDEIIKEILDQMEKLASKGLRVLAMAHNNTGASSQRAVFGIGDEDGSDTPDDKELLGAGPVGSNLPNAWNVDNREEIEKKLTFIGLVGMFDPPRADTGAAVQEAYGAGIVVHMATGDHFMTAQAIAKMVHIVSDDDIKRNPALVMVAKDFDRMTDAEIDALPELPRVLARCSPASKVKLIHALHRRTKKVVMTGDGVNDAPAVRQADVGIAMGFGGSDVTKQASHMVLTDDNFSTILRAIAEGRRIFANISKFVVHLLAANIAEVVTLIIGLAISDSDGLSVFPMSPVQILWLNMLTSSFPAFGLGVDPPSPDTMMVAPRAANSGLFTKEVVVDTFVYGIFLGVVGLMSFILVLFAFGDGVNAITCNHEFSAECSVIFRGRATAFLFLSFSFLILAYICRHSRRSIFKMEVLANRPLLWCISVGGILSIMSVYIPYLNESILLQSGISWEWSIVAIGLVLFVAYSELYKFLKRRYWPVAKTRQTKSKRIRTHPEIENATEE